MSIRIREKIAEALAAALEHSGVGAEEVAEAQVTAAADLRFGDYQTNAAMIMAKRRRENPRTFAEAVVARMELEGLATTSIAGPGFINFTVEKTCWAQALEDLLKDERLGVAQASEAKSVVVDFSAPNVAKPMHVGHIRSTIIGDCLARVASFLGHRVVRDNHLGDWGTQFGMVLWAWKRGVQLDALERGALVELLRLYREANAACKDDEAIREACRQELVKLQQGDEENLEIWERCVALSRAGLEKIYNRLDVSFDEWLGESFYNDRLKPLVDDLLEKGLAEESRGAICIFSDEESSEKEDPFKIKTEGGWANHPMLVRKSDGGYNYATTDLATIDYRKERWKVDQIWYVVDVRQSLHFQQLFSASERRGIRAELQHIAFGTILGTDRRPLKTRDGDLPQLADVLEDAVRVAQEVLEEKNSNLKADERNELAEMIGIGSIKFTELSHHRMSDYVFDLKKMVALEGDTAPYLQYSYVRVRSIFRKLGEPPSFSGKFHISEDGELNLVRMLVRFSEVVPIVLDDFRPNLLAAYLLDLAKAFHSFFENCPVLKSEEPVRLTRLALCEGTARTLKLGMGLLGIQAPERM